MSAFFKSKKGGIGFEKEKNIVLNDQLRGFVVTFERFRPMLNLSLFSYPM